MRALITGAAGVYGRELAKAFAREGADLVLTDYRKDALEAVAAQHGAQAIACNLTDADDIVRMAEVVLAGGVPDVVVSNAGIYPFGGLLDTDIATYDRIMDVNVRAAFVLTQRIARAMIETGRKGCFVYIGSSAADLVRRNGIVYCASKRALDWLVKGMALDLAPHGIRCNEVAPGFAEGSTEVDMPAEHIAAIRRQMPMGRPPEPWEMTEAVLFLASDKARSITGTRLSVDGGGGIPRRA